MMLFELFTFCYMAVETWGLLPKSQTDSETIEQAIVRIVAEHNDDPEAHTAAGQAIAVHRENEIIDHKAGSVFADKLTMRDLTIFDDFRSLAHWSTVGSVDNGNWPAVSLYIESGAVEKSELYKQAGLPSQWLDYTKDMLFQIVGRLDLSTNNYDSWFGIALNSIAPADGFGFIVDNGVLYAVLDNGATNLMQEISGVGLSVDHVYRAQYTGGTLTADFYIDNALVATLTRSNSTGGVDVMARIGIQTDGSTDGNFVVGGLYCAREI